MDPEKKFSMGQWCIDTRRRTAPTVINCIPGDMGDVYILEDDDGSVYLAKEDDLIPYDKYYFDREKTDE